LKSLHASRWLVASADFNRQIFVRMLVNASRVVAQDSILCYVVHRDHTSRFE